MVSNITRSSCRSKSTARRSDPGSSSAVVSMKSSGGTPPIFAIAEELLACQPRGLGLCRVWGGCSTSCGARSLHTPRVAACSPMKSFDFKFRRLFSGAANRLLSFRPYYLSRCANWVFALITTAPYRGHVLYTSMKENRGRLKRGRSLKPANSVRAFFFVWRTLRRWGQLGNSM